MAEEAGISVELSGLLEIEHTPLSDGSSRMGLSFLATPAPGAALKSTPDEESRGARWFGADEIGALTLRSARVGRLVRAAFAGADAIPLTRLAGSR